MFNSTKVTAIVQYPNDSPPQIQLSTSTAVVSEGIERGSLVPGLNMVITDPDRVRTMNLFIACAGGQGCRHLVDWVASLFAESRSARF